MQILSITKPVESALHVPTFRPRTFTLGLEAHWQGLWTEAELGRFLGLTRLALDQFLKDHGVKLNYDWDDLEYEREVHRGLTGM